MKIANKFFYIVLVSVVTLMACKPSENKKEQEEHAVTKPAELKTALLHIEGMTCEIGCAKIIESKISKLKGVTASKVDFEAKKGTFTYDAHQTSENKIVSTIDGLLDGKTYKATKNKTCTDACAEKCGHKVGETCEMCNTKDEKACCETKHK